MPIQLTKSQQKDPVASIDFVCGAFTLHEVRQRLREMLQAAISSSLCKEDGPEEKKEKMDFFNELIQLVESAYLLNQMVIEGRMTYSIKKKKQRVPDPGN